MEELEGIEDLDSIIFEHVGNSTRKTRQHEKLDAPMGDLALKAAEILFEGNVPETIGISTKDGTVIEHWDELTVRQFMDQYGNHVIMGTENELGH